LDLAETTELLFRNQIRKASEGVSLLYDFDFPDNEDDIPLPTNINLKEK
jgi:hypothetical protein